MANAARVRPLGVDELRPLAESLARRIARQPADVDDLTQVGLFAVFVDYKRLVARTSGPAPLPTQAKAWSLARQILRRAMLGYYGRAEERKSARCESLEHIGTIVLPRVDSQSELLEMDDYLSAVERTLGVKARQVAENLIEPRGECASALLVAVQRKRRAQARGRRRRVRFSNRAVRDAMGMGSREWSETLNRVRGFTREWITKTA